MPFKPEFVFQGKEGTDGKEDAQAGRADDSSGPGIQHDNTDEGSAREEKESYRVVLSPTKCFQSRCAEVNCPTNTSISPSLLLI